MGLNAEMARRLDALDAMAEEWAKKVDLAEMAAAIAKKPDAVIRIIALVKQGFVEGAYLQQGSSRGAVTLKLVE
jgi:hypothetical protein